jgi:hypothetical protein
VVDQLAQPESVRLERLDVDAAALLDVDLGAAIALQVVEVREDSFSVSKCECGQRMIVLMPFALRYSMVFCQRDVRRPLPELASQLGPRTGGRCTCWFDRK